jgi:hypothetical protein
MWLKLQCARRVLLTSCAGDVSRTLCEVSSVTDDRRRATVVAAGGGGAICGPG